MKITTKQLVTTAIILAICIISQFFKNMSVYITGPIINACLVICVLTCGLLCGIILSVITPVTSFFITGSPIIAAVPAIMPCIMIGNAILVICIHFITKKKSGDVSLIISMAVGCIAKALFMGISIALIILPNMLPEKMLPKLPVFQTTFSVTQLITAVIGCVIAYIIWIPLKKSFSSQA